MRLRDEGGVSLVEVLIGATMFALIGAGFFSVLVSVARGTESTTDSVRISEEARLGLNRLVRDVREAGWIDLSSTNPNATHNSFTVKVDYNTDGAYANPPSATAEGHYEVLTYAYDAANRRITVTAPGVGTETLVSGVDCIRATASGPCTRDVFSFTSNRLEYDWGGPGAATTPDGVTTMAEVDEAPCPAHGVTALDSTCSNGLVAAELATLSSVNIAVELTTGGRSTDYFAEAQLRNRR